MSLTLLALFLAPLYLLMVVNPKEAYQLSKNLAKNGEFRILFSMVLLLLSIIILAETGIVLEFSWENLLGWIGIVIGLKAALLMLVPSLGKLSFKKGKMDQLPIWGFLGLLVVLFLVYVDTQIIA